MRKIFLLPLVFLGVSAKATIWNVNVSNFQFSPNTLNVVVGDVIHWQWVGGNHTTTSTSVPSGANTWNNNITLANQTFDYTVTQAGSYSYLCQIHGAGMSGSFTASAPIPVVLSYFNISAVNNKPHLIWKTATESNSDYFSIRKSNNGTDFTEIAKITASVNSLVEKTYSFTDNDPGVGQFIYYSLGIKDKNGNMQLSPIKIYKNSSESLKLIISLSPNPISSAGHLLLKFNADKPGNMIAKIYDIRGKLILKTELSAETGINNGHIHLGDISEGIYTITFWLNGIKESYKILKK
ncbi:hypothetical protein BH09BAC2_BH09BAC2_05110 [soil metagenome]